MTKVRSWLINAIPYSIKQAIGAGIGLFIAFIGLQNAGNGVLRKESHHDTADLALKAHRREKADLLFSADPGEKHRAYAGLSLHALPEIGPVGDIHRFAAAGVIRAATGHEANPVKARGALQFPQQCQIRFR